MPTTAASARGALLEVLYRLKQFAAYLVAVGLIGTLLGGVSWVLVQLAATQFVSHESAVAAAKAQTERLEARMDAADSRLELRADAAARLVSERLDVHDKLLTETRGDVRQILNLLLTERRESHGNR